MRVPTPWIQQARNRLAGPLIASWRTTSRAAALNRDPTSDGDEIWRLLRLQQGD